MTARLSVLKESQHSPSQARSRSRNKNTTIGIGTPKSHNNANPIFPDLDFRGTLSFIWASIQFLSQLWIPPSFVQGHEPIAQTKHARRTTNCDTEHIAFLLGCD